MKKLLGVFLTGLILAILIAVSLPTVHLTFDDFIGLLLFLIGLPGTAYCCFIEKEPDTKDFIIMTLLTLLIISYYSFMDNYNTQKAAIKIALYNKH